MTSPYPASTELKDNFSIFHLALRHKVSCHNFAQFSQRLAQHHWELHEYFKVDPFLTGLKPRRAFAPHTMLTPYAYESLFGQTWFEDGQLKSGVDKCQTVLKERLNPKGKTTHQENLLLTQQADQPWINTPLQLKYKKRLFIFTIKWADLWLFNDKTGILAFKMRLEQVHKAGQMDLPCVDDLSFFNRIIRYPGSPYKKNQVEIQVVDDPKQSIKFWDKLVYQQWLGLRSRQQIASNPSEANENVLMLDKPREEILDRYTRHSKLLTFAQIPNLQAGEEEFLWNRPVNSPDFTANANYKQFAQGEWSPILEAYQQGLLAGYPSVRDMLLLELATVSGEGQTWHDDQKEWHFDTHYVARLLAENGIKVWAYWTGLALRDICAFIVYDDSMRLGSKQVEESYYPLYIHSYHQRFRLDCFSQDIIDHGLHDCVKSRQILEDFNAFHNQYWFQEVTVDFLGIEIADRMKAGFGIENKYQVVKEEIKDVTGFIDSKIQAGRQALLAILILAFYPLQYFGLGDWLQALVSGNLGLSISLTFGFFFLVLLLGRFFLPRFFGFFCRFLAKFYPKGAE